MAIKLDMSEVSCHRLPLCRRTSGTAAFCPLPRALGKRRSHASHTRTYARTLAPQLASQAKLLETEAETIEADLSHLDTTLFSEGASARAKAEEVPHSAWRPKSKAGVDEDADSNIKCGATSAQMADETPDAVMAAKDDDLYYRARACAFVSSSRRAREELAQRHLEATKALDATATYFGCQETGEWCLAQLVTLCSTLTEHWPEIPMPAENAAPLPSPERDTLAPSKGAGGSPRTKHKGAPALETAVSSIESHMACTPIKNGVPHDTYGKDTKDSAGTILKERQGQPSDEPSGSDAALSLFSDSSRASGQVVYEDDEEYF